MENLTASLYIFVDEDEEMNEVYFCDDCVDQMRDEGFEVISWDANDHGICERCQS